MARILQVFNRYVHMGGEEKSVDRIYTHLGQEHTMERCFFESRAWKGHDAPHALVQLRRAFYNHEARARFEKMCDDFRPDAALFHNAFPVGSPSLYHAALERRLPVIHYVHNFRPFSVGGTLQARGQFMEEALRGDYRREVRAGAWQGSILKSWIMARVLTKLHRSGWLGCVKAWVCISDFLRDKLLHGTGTEPKLLHALRHSWDAMPHPPAPGDDGGYLFLSRLVEVKGVAVLLKAWEIVEQKLGDKAPELRIGGEGPMEDAIHAFRARGHRVQFLGVVQGREKQGHIARCRAMLAPSTWWEPLGLVTYEAYDSAKPMLAARSGGLTETVQDGETGFLHEPGNAQSLADTILRLEAMPPEQRLTMGQAGRRWLLANADAGAWKRAFNTILDQALQGRGVAR